MRFEKKFPIKYEYLNSFYSWLDQIKGLKEIYHQRVVNSIYYDNSFLECANDNLSGISYRHKYRIRWYGNNQNTNFNYEIKIKKNELGKKIILPSKLKLINSNINNLFLLNNRELNQLTNSKAVFYYISKTNLKPILETSYIRTYYLYMNKINITFDKSLKFRNLKYKSKNNEFLKDSISVMEIKFNPKDLMFVKDFIKHSRFIQLRFSKYLRGLALVNLAQYI